MHAKLDLDSLPDADLEIWTQRVMGIEGMDFHPCNDWRDIGLMLTRVLLQHSGEGWIYKVRLSLQPPEFEGRTHVSIVEVHPKKPRQMSRHFQASDTNPGRAVCKAILRATGVGAIPPDIRDSRPPWASSPES